MDKERCNGPMERSTLVNGEKTSLMDKDSIFIQMEMYTKENGQMTKRMDMEFKSVPMEPYTKVLIKIVKDMERVWRPGLVGKSTRENGHSIKEMVSENKR